MYKAIYLSPMVPSFNIEGTRDFFIEILQFSSVVDLENYVIISKDDLTIHLLRAGKDIGQMEFYLEVDDINTLWESTKNKLEGIKVREFFDREYGMRKNISEYHIPTLYYLSVRI